jgi:hypothetical protein
VEEEVTRPRSERPGHPSWCVKDDDTRPVVHTSKVLRAGQRRHGGESAVWLTVTGTGQPVVHVTVAHMAWASIDMPPHEAATLRDQLTAMLQAAGHE